MSARSWPMRCKGKGSCGYPWQQPLTESARRPVHCPRCRKSQRVPAEAWRGVPSSPAARPSRSSAVAVRAQPVQRPPQPRRVAVVDDEDQATDNGERVSLVAQFAGGLVGDRPGARAAGMAAEAVSGFRQRDRVVLQGEVLPTDADDAPAASAALPGWLRGSKPPREVSGHLVPRGGPPPCGRAA
jgi:hypothetical protein